MSFQRWDENLTCIIVECSGVPKMSTLRFDKWIVRMIEYGFEKNKDFNVFKFEQIQFLTTPILGSLTI